MNTSNSKNYLKDMAEFVTLILVAFGVLAVITWALYQIAGEFGMNALRWSVVVLIYLVAIVGFLGYRLGRAYRDGVRDSLEMHGTLRTAAPAGQTIDNAPPVVDRLPLTPRVFGAEESDALLRLIEKMEE